ncbi:MAG: hypothetical protein WC157_02945, partial [Candidatus Paceibacterota bacterium]
SRVTIPLFWPRFRLATFGHVCPRLARFGHIQFSKTLYLYSFPRFKPPFKTLNLATFGHILGHIHFSKTLYLYSFPRHYPSFLATFSLGHVQCKKTQRSIKHRCASVLEPNKSPFLYIKLLKTKTKHIKDSKQY